MPSITEIALARKAALHEIDVVRAEAARRRRASTSDATKKRMKVVIDEMDANEERVSAAAVRAMDESEEMHIALETLGRVAQETDDKALRMKTITDFLFTASGVASAVKKFADILTRMDVEKAAENA